jgi:hypothetical protein
MPQVALNASTNRWMGITQYHDYCVWLRDGLYFRRYCGHRHLCRGALLIDGGRSWCCDRKSVTASPAKIRHMRSDGYILLCGRVENAAVVNKVRSVMRMGLRQAPA